MDRKKSLITAFIEYTLTIEIGVIFYFSLIETYSLLMTVLIIDIIMTIIIFIFSIIHNNSSVYDPYWSVVPFFIVLLYMLHLNLFNIVSYSILIGVFIYGLRLTSNWFLNYEGLIKEDFRYKDFRERFKKYYWVISFLGIHLFPTLIVFLGLYPIYYVFTNSINYEVFIYIGVLVMLISATISYYADNQLRRHKRSNSTESIKTGLWKYSRHPNYLAELIFWVGCYIVGLSVGFNLYASLGVIGMIILFNFYSIPKMEKKLLKSKTDYQFIIKSVPRLLPTNLFKKDEGLDSYEGSN